MSFPFPFLLPIPTQILHRRNILPTRPSRRTLLISLGAILLLAIATPFAWQALKRHVEPVIRSQIIATLGKKLHANVTVGPILISYGRSLRFEAKDIRAIPIGAPPKAPPILTINSLRAYASLHNLFTHGTDFSTVAATGLTVNLSTTNRQLLASAASPSSSETKLPFNRIKIDDSTFILEPSTPGKPALTITCSQLILNYVNDLTRPVAYDATLSSPIPSLHATGQFGPLNLATVRDTRIDGTYSFAGASLTPIPGLLGTLSSTGTLSGTLGQITLAGSAQSQNFALDISAHPMPVLGNYRALFDLTSGDIALPELNVRFANTPVQIAGTITRETAGRHIAAEIRIQNGRNEDLFTLLDNTAPVLTAALNLTAHVDLPAGPQRFILRLHSTGTATLTDAHWTIPAVQHQIDDISLRASDEARRAKQPPIPIVPSTVTGTFNLQSSIIAIHNMVYTVPGATLLMDGQYPLAAPNVSFHGIARTVATASQMETGIKSLLLKPISPLLKKPGAGMQIPISFTGPKSNPTLSLDLLHPNQDKSLATPNPPTPKL